jgi:hypothetical protein
LDGSSSPLVGINGSHTSIFGGQFARDEATPTMVVGSPFSSTVFPTMARSAPNCRRHTASERIAIRGAPLASSPRTKARPSTGGTPITSKKVSLTRAVDRRSGWSPAPVRLAVPSSNAAIDTKLRDCVR